MQYTEFLQAKAIAHVPSGINLSPVEVNSILFPFQREMTSRVLKLGKGALFAQTGLGKSGCEWAWSDLVATETQKPVLLLTPLAVASQMLKECRQFGYELNFCENQADVKKGINITNYEKLHKFDARSLGGICLDEASIVKNFAGKMSNALIEFARSIPYRLSATATPAPNDYEEFGTQAEFLGVMKRSEMLSTFFHHEGGNTSEWTLMHYAEDRFWEWVASWATVVRKPSDLGEFDDSPYNLPPVIEHWHQVEGSLVPDEGELIKILSGMSDRRSAKRSSLTDRCELAAEIVNNSDESWLIWCELNAEGDYLAKIINDSFQVSGSDKPEVKEKRLIGFSNEDYRNLITKPKISGFGMNWQHCRNILFVGVDDSWERRYQAIKRCDRFGQKRQVNVHTIYSSVEQPVIDNLNRKQKQADRMGDRMAAVMKRSSKSAHAPMNSEYNPTQKMELPSWIFA